MPLTVGQKATRDLTLTKEHVQKYAEITGDHTSGIESTVRDCLADHAGFTSTPSARTASAFQKHLDTVHDRWYERAPIHRKSQTSEGHEGVRPFPSCQSLFYDE